MVEMCWCQLGLGGWFDRAFLFGLFLLFNFGVKETVCKVIWMYDTCGREKPWLSYGTGSTAVKLKQDKRAGNNESRTTLS